MFGLAFRRADECDSLFGTVCTGRQQCCLTNEYGRMTLFATWKFNGKQKIVERFIAYVSRHTHTHRLVECAVEIALKHQFGVSNEPRVFQRKYHYQFFTLLIWWLRLQLNSDKKWSVIASLLHGEYLLNILL